MSTGAGPASRGVVEGTVRYPPSLGFERAADGRMRARLANTLSTTSGVDVTVVFRGDRAEVAERLLVRGSRVGVVGVWDEDRQELLVERFDVAGTGDDHPYRLGGRPTAEVAADVDVSQLYETGAVSGWPEGLPPPPSEEFTLAEGQGRPGPPVAPSQPPADGDTERPASARFAPGQRVVAGDRGNVGTVVAVDPTGQQVRVRFVSPGGSTAVVGLASTELTLARRQQAPRRDQALHGAAEANADSRRPQVTPHRDAPTVGPAMGVAEDGGAVEAPTAGRASTDGTQGRHRSGVVPSGEEMVGGRVEVPLGMSPLRVHTRRPGPTGEIQL